MLNNSQDWAVQNRQDFAAKNVKILQPFFKRLKTARACVTELPLTLRCHIASFVPLHTRAVLMETCRAWAAIANQPLSLCPLTTPLTSAKLHILTQDEWAASLSRLVNLMRISGRCGFEYSPSLPDSAPVVAGYWTSTDAKHNFPIAHLTRLLISCNVELTADDTKRLQACSKLTMLELTNHVHLPRVKSCTQLRQLCFIHITRCFGLSALHEMHANGLESIDAVMSGEGVQLMTVPGFGRLPWRNIRLYDMPHACHARVHCTGHLELVTHQFEDVKRLADFPIDCRDIRIDMNLFSDGIKSVNKAGMKVLKRIKDLQSIKVCKSIAAEKEDIITFSCADLPSTIRSVWLDCAVVKHLESLGSALESLTLVECEADMSRLPSHLCTLRVRGKCSGLRIRHMTRLSYLWLESADMPNDDLVSLIQEMVELPKLTAMSLPRCLLMDKDMVDLITQLCVQRKLPRIQSIQMSTQAWHGDAVIRLSDASVFIDATMGAFDIPCLSMPEHVRNKLLL